MNPKSRIRVIAKYAFYYGFAFIWFVPVLWMTSSAFKPKGEIISFTPQWFPSVITLENLNAFLAEHDFVLWMTNSAIVAAGATAVTLVTATLAAYAFSRISWPGRDVVFVILLTAMFIPWEINAIPLFFIAKDLGLLNTFQGVFLPISAMPISMFLLRQFFITIPAELEDAARIDGCGHLGILRYVIVPVSGPAFAALSIFIFIFSWNEFFWSLIALRQSDLLTLPIGMKTLVAADNIQYDTLMAGSFLASLPSLAVFAILRRQIISGISMVGVGK